MNYPAASCGVSKVAASTYNPICYTALFPLHVYRLFYNFLGTVIGSCLNFYLARRWGQPLVHNLVEEKTREKYLHWLEDGKKFDWLFASAILLPFFPDDALCLVAGLSKMSWKRFLWIMLLKLPSIAVYSIIYLTAGQLLGQ